MAYNFPGQPRINTLSPRPYNTTNYKTNTINSSEDLFYQRILLFKSLNRATKDPDTMAEKLGNEVREYGDLLVTMTSDYDWLWGDHGSGSKKDCGVWHAKAQYNGTLKPLGSIAFGSYNGPTGNRATLLVGANANSGGTPAVKAPTGYTRVWKDEGSGGRYNGSFWRPTAPSGYVAVGDVCSDDGWSEPSKSMIWCLRADLVSDGSYSGDAVWTDRGSGAKANVSLWDVLPVTRGLHGNEKVPILADCFRSIDSWDTPPTSIARVPVLVVKNNFERFDTPVPELDPHNLPTVGEIIGKKEQCRVTLPFVAFFSPKDRSCVDNVAQPYCIISRSCGWKADKVFSNDAREPFPYKETVEKGVTESQTRDFSHSAGVDISASAGIFGASFNIGLSYQFTYQESYSFTEYQRTTKELTLTVSPYTAIVAFIRHLSMKATRSDESWVLHEILFNANDEIFIKEADLRFLDPRLEN
jgi:hypothetical protein